MRTPEKWINVDESFAKNIRHCTRQSHRCQNLLSTTKSRGWHLKSWKCKAFVGFAGADYLDETRSLESVSLQKDYVQYASDFGKPVSINEVQRNKWGRWLSTSEVETQILPQLREHIRQKLGKPDWKFQLDVENIGKKKKFIIYG